MALRDKDVFPSDEVLTDTLGDSFAAFVKLREALISNDITPEWNFYRDGSAWLCKTLFKKKNLAWLHVYDGYFIVTCHFMERHIPEIEGLEVADNIKNDFFSTHRKNATKLIPMSITVLSATLPDDVMTMILFKRSIK